jgi:hypothetical protein
LQHEYAGAITVVTNVGFDAQFEIAIRSRLDAGPARHVTVHGIVTGIEYRGVVSESRHAFRRFGGAGIGGQRRRVVILVFIWPDAHTQSL